MGDIGKRDVDILREKVGNGLSPLGPRLAAVPTEHAGNESVRMAQPDVFSTGEPPSDSEFPVDEESGSEYGGPVVPAKRKRRTNNSFALDLDDDDSEVLLPPPLKRLQFNPNGKENSVLIGVWKDSPPLDLVKKHAVYAFIDNADRVRQKVYPETRNGEILQDGYPSGTGRAFVTPENVILDPHLSLLSRPELKEYIRLRMSHSSNESPEERKKAEALAIEEAKKIVSRNISQAHLPIPSPSVTPKPRNSTAQDTPESKIPNGILLGFWKNSDSSEDADKHATFGIVDSNRLRVKIVKITRDGRPCHGNFPSNPGSNWIPYDDVVLEPALQRLLRLQVIEYVKIRQNERGRPDFDPFKIDENAIRKAIENFDAIAKAQGTSAAKLDAQHEISRKAHNQSRAAYKASPTAAKDSKYESPYAPSTGNSYAQDPTVRGETRSKLADTRATRMNENVTTPRASEGSRAKESLDLANSPKPSHLPAKTNASETSPEVSNPDVPEGKAKAIKSKKADAHAIAEKLRRVREAAAKAKERENPNGGSKDASIDGKETSHISNRRIANEPQEVARQAREIDEAYSNRIEERTSTVEQALQFSDRRDREAARHQDLPKQGESMTSRQRAIKEAEARAMREAEARAMREAEARAMKEAEARAMKEAEAKATEARAKIARDIEAMERAEAGVRSKLEKARTERERAQAAAIDGAKAKDHEANETRAEIQHARAELERAKAAAIESVSNEFFDHLDSFEDHVNVQSESNFTAGPSLGPVTPTNRSRPAAEIKIHNDIKYVRQDKGPFAGKLVGEKKEVLTIDGENYVECRILMRAEF